MCTFLFFPLFLRSLSRCLHTQVSLSLPFFFFGFLSLLATFFFLFVYFTSFFLFFFLAPFNSRFVFASFYRKKKKRTSLLFHTFKSRKWRPFLAFLMWKKEKEGKEGTGQTAMYLSACLPNGVHHRQAGRLRHLFFFSSQESTTSGCSLTSFPPPPTLLLITCSFLLLFGCPQFPWRASFISDFCDPSHTRTSILPARSNSLFSSCENETGAP